MYRIKKLSPHSPAMCWACASPASGGGALHYKHGPPTIINPKCTCQWILDHTIRNWPSWVPDPKCHHCDELLQEKLRKLPPSPLVNPIGPKTLGETLVTQEVWSRLRKLSENTWATDGMQQASREASGLLFWSTTLKDWDEALEAARTGWKETEDAWEAVEVLLEEPTEEQQMLNILLP